MLSHLDCGLKNIGKNYHPLVSVVITTKNEENNIANCLKSIKAQSYKNIETIVVDNFSSDRTLEISKKYTEKIALFGPERSAQRNHGMINMSAGEYVIYVDADMLLSPILIECCVDYIFKTGSVALHIPEIVLGNNYLSEVRRFERGFYDGTAIDGARFFNRMSFSQVGGFDEVLFAKGSGEDWDIDKLIKSLGVINLLPRFSNNIIQENIWSLKKFVEERGVIHNPMYAGIYHNEQEFNLISYIKKKSYYSLGFDGYIAKWGKDDADIKKQFGISYRFWTVFMEDGKWRRMIANLNLVLGLYFLRILVGLAYVARNAPDLKTILKRLKK